MLPKKTNAIDSFDARGRFAVGGEGNGRKQQQTAQQAVAQQAGQGSEWTVVHRLASDTKGAVLGILRR